MTSNSSLTLSQTGLCTGLLDFPMLGHIVDLQSLAVEAMDGVGKVFSLTLNLVPRASVGWL